MTTASGSVSSTTLKVLGGLCRQMLIRALTSGATVFKANIEDEDGLRVLDYAYHNGEINDTGASGALPLPMAGEYTINITNASPDDTFQIYAVIQE